MSAVAMAARAVAVASAGRAARELHLVELGFAVLLSGCAVAAVALLGTCGRKGR